MDELTAAGQSAPDRATGEDIDRAYIEHAKTMLRKIDKHYIAQLDAIASDGRDSAKYDRVWRKWIVAVTPFERILDA